jgi:hypothetical protein
VANLRLFETMVLLLKSVRINRLICLYLEIILQYLEHRSVLTQWDSTCSHEQFGDKKELSRESAEGLEHISSVLFRTQFNIRVNYRKFICVNKK